jgi:pentapeptide repeat protein
MSPEVIAAIIAGSVSVLTFVGTLAAQVLGRRATSKDTEATLKEQSKQLNTTLKEQGKQLDRTLEEQRARTLNERFATAAYMLGIDQPAAVRLAGIYAMSGLADEWEDNRQTCIDVLCGYLRMPYPADPGDGEKQLGFLADREVRHTVIRVITAHLRDEARKSWQDKEFDFTGVVFDGGDFSDAVFSGNVRFSSAVFSDGVISFHGSKFTGGRVAFDSAVFSGGRVEFPSAVFSGGRVTFRGAKFTGGWVRFRSAVFSRSTVSFRSAVFSHGRVSFTLAEFSGGTVDFRTANFAGGDVDFSKAASWTHQPQFDWEGIPPSGVKLPPQLDASGPELKSEGADSPRPPEPDAIGGSAAGPTAADESSRTPHQPDSHG